MKAFVPAFLAAIAATANAAGRPPMFPVDGKSAAPGDRADQSLTCYEYWDQQGQYRTFTDYVDNLRDYGWDNRISSCCFTGIWILYDRANYNDNSETVSKTQIVFGS